LLSSLYTNTSAALKLASLLNQVNSHEFDIFELDKIAQQKTLFIMSNEIFNRCGFLEFIEEDKFKEFILNITKGYDRSIPYHNVKLLYKGFACWRRFANCLHYF
jgi:hypothetical protein